MDWYGTSHLAQDIWDIPLDHCGTPKIAQDHLGHHRTCGNDRDVPLGHPILPKTIWDFPWTTWDVPLDHCGTSNIAQDHSGHHRTCRDGRDVPLGHPILPQTTWDFPWTTWDVPLDRVGHLTLPKTTWTIPSCPRPFGTSHWTI